MNKVEYYAEIARYFDSDARDFEDRYWKNPVLQRVRQSLREEVKKNSFDKVLEIGFGTGIDVCHFAAIFPDRKVYGIDISSEMLNHAHKKVESLHLENVFLKVGSPEDLESLFPGVIFDHIYVFFGALNTVADLKEVASTLKKKLSADGTMVLTFVNKWYLAEIFISLLKLEPKKAFKRFRHIWGGYSDAKYLESRCLTPRDIRVAFESDFIIRKRKGFSILYPAWYRYWWITKFGSRITELLWNTDQFLNKTPLWCLGEYSLYCFSTRETYAKGNIA